MSDIGEDLRGTTILGMQHDADTQFVGGAFHTNCDHDGRYFKVSMRVCQLKANRIIRNV